MPELDLKKAQDEKDTERSADTGSVEVVVAGEVRLTRWAKLYYLAIPFFVTVGILALFVVFKGWGFTGKLAAFAGTQFFVAGKFIVFAGLNKAVASEGFTPLFFVLLVIYMDVLVGTIVMINVSAFYHLPFIGRKLDVIQRNSAEILSANPWARKLTFLSLMMFVAFPLTGTGAIGGGFFGRMLGLTRKLTFLGLICGSAMGAGFMYMLAMSFGNVYKNLEGNVPAQVGLVAGGLGVIALFIYALSRRLKKGFTGSRVFKKPDV